MHAYDAAHCSQGSEDTAPEEAFTKAREVLERHPGAVMISLVGGHEAWTTWSEKNADARTLWCSNAYTNYSQGGEKHITVVYTKA
jgi:hypothetical protein